MLVEDLIELVERVRHQKAEGQTVEIKTAHEGCPRHLYDTLSSFSNQDTGGVLVFGINEKKEFAIDGVYDVQALQVKVTEQCNQMEPPVRAVFTVAEIEGKFVCSAEIPGIDVTERPCFYKGRGRSGGAYVRVGDADLQMTDREVYYFEAFRKHVHDDERVVERASLAEFEQFKVDYFLAQKTKDRPAFAQFSKEKALELLNVTHHGLPTIAAVMNFALLPQAYFPMLGITAVVVPGMEIGDVTDGTTRFLDNKRIEGSLSEMLEGALHFCLRNMKTKTIIDNEGHRKDRGEYPEKALREAILNALVHRDYSSLSEGTPVQIAFFTNRVEIRNPGNLYGRMTVKQPGIAHPDVRNPTLAIMAEALLGTENRYSGIPTMCKAMEEYGLPPPKFENRRDEFIVTFFNQAQEDISPEQTVNERLLEFCLTPRTRREIAAFLNIKTASYAMAKYINPLLESGELGMSLPEKPQSVYQQYFAKTEPSS